MTKTAHEYIRVTYEFLRVHTSTYEHERKTKKCESRIGAQPPDAPNYWATGRRGVELPIQFMIFFFFLGGQFTQTADITLQRQMSAPDIGLQRQDIAQFTRQLSTPAPQDLAQQAQQQQYTTNPQYQTPQF